MRWARVGYHRAVLDAAGAIAPHRGDEVNAFLVTAWEDEYAYGDVQPRTSLKSRG